MTVRQPPYCIEGSLSQSVETELIELLARARRGELIGLAYVVTDKRHRLDAGLAGNLGRDAVKAIGALQIAASAARDSLK